MEFRFNFPDPDDGIENEVKNSSSETSDKEAESSVGIAFEVTVDNVYEVNQFKINHLEIGKSRLAYICNEDLQNSLKEIKDERISLAVKSHSDLIPGVYEGGLKIWECTLDLINYLNELDAIKGSMHILELGCGTGLAGIFAYLKGAKVDFQDYNEEVLKLVTIKNVILNTESQDVKDVSDKCRFFAGDWDAVNRLFQCPPEKFKYDMIITSETIYDPNNQEKLLRLMKNTLKPNGKIYLAAKTCYFGVGGGTCQFEEVVKRDAVFDIQLGKAFTEDVRREIFILQFK